MQFKLEDGYCKEDSLLYIPCKTTEKLGYICIDGYGVPLGYDILASGKKKYWFGSKDFSWVPAENLFRGYNVSGFISGKTTVATATMVELHIRFYVKEVRYLFCRVLYDLQGGIYRFTVSVPDVGAIYGNLYQVPQSVLSKLTLML